jgi:hypothetical protein
MLRIVVHTSDQSYQSKSKNSKLLVSLPFMYCVSDEYFYQELLKTVGPRVSNDWLKTCDLKLSDPSTRKSGDGQAQHRKSPNFQCQAPQRASSPGNWKEYEIFCPAPSEMDSPLMESSCNIGLLFTDAAHVVLSSRRPVYKPQRKNSCTF